MANALTKRLLKLVQSDYEDEESKAVATVNNNNTIGQSKRREHENSSKSVTAGTSNKRQRRSKLKYDDDNEIATKEDIMNWHIRLIQHRDNQLTNYSSNTDSSSTKKINDNVYSRHTNKHEPWSTEILQKLEKDNDKKSKEIKQYKQLQSTVLAGASRTTTSSVQQQHKPVLTFNKKKYEQEKQQKETLKLAKKFMLLDKIKKKQQKKILQSQKVAKINL